MEVALDQPSSRLRPLVDAAVAGERDAFRALTGRYVFADYSADWTSNDPQPRGSLLVAEPGADDAPWEWRRLSVASDELDRVFVTGMGEDARGELYVMARRSLGPISRTGFVFKIVPVS